MSFFSRKCKPTPILFLLFLSVVIWAVVIGAILAPGLATRPAYYKLDYGMSMQQVAELMGKPKHILEWGHGECWKYCGDQPLIDVHFEGDRLVSTSRKGIP